LVLPWPPQTAEPAETLSVIVADGTLSLEATNAPLDRVLIKIGETIHARIVIETILAEDLAKARVDTSFIRVPVTAALRRLLRGRQYVMLYGPAGVDEIRVYVDGASGYRELTPPDPLTQSRPTSIPLAGWPPDDLAAIARLRQAVLHGPDASARAEALDELSNIRNTRLVVETLAEVLARERDSMVLRPCSRWPHSATGIPSEALLTLSRVTGRHAPGPGGRVARRPGR
jgi:hypothetical protein